MMGRVKTVFPYPGGKSFVAELLAEHVPPGVTHMASPFFGGGSFERHCADHLGLQVTGADLFEPLANFWCMLKQDARALADECSRHVPEHAADYKRLLQLMEDAAASDLHRAACFYNCVRSAYSGVLHATFMPVHVGRLRRSIPQLAEVDMRGIEVVHSDFEPFILQHKDAWLYLDPPYYQRVRLYANTGSNKGRHLHHTAAFDHARLREVLRDHPSWMLSYNDCDYVRELYAGHRMQPIEFTNRMARPRKAAARNNRELLIFSEKISP
jgi:DNA adenine methylase